MTGVTPITRAGGKEVYRIAFSYRAAQCREIMALPHSKANEAYCVRLRAEIMGRIERGDFRYSDYFPGSSRAGAYAHGTHAKTIGKALEAYRDRTKSTLEASTWEPYRRDIENVLIPAWGRLRISEFRQSHVRDWVAKQGVGLKRIRNILLPIRAVLKEAMADQLISSDPLAGMDLAKLVPIEKRTTDYEVKPYTLAELAKVLANVPEPERWAFQFWAFTGLRTGELIGLRWPRIDLEAKTVRITETTTLAKDKPRTKTKAGMRTIPLLPAALEAVEGMRKFTQLGGDRFTVNPRGRRDDKAWDTNKLASVWERAHRGTGVAKRNPYQLRHTFASQLLSQGENIAYIAKLMGHKTVDEVIRTYGRWVDEGERLGFDRPPRQYGVSPLWGHAACVNSV